MSVTDWQARTVPSAMTAERLAALVDREIERSETMLFTLTSRDELDAIGRSQALADQAFAQQVRVITAAHSRASAEQREFAADELALALGVGWGTAHRVLHQALGLAGLPGMVEALHAGLLTQRHALAVLRTLDEVQLSTEQRVSIALIVLARLSGQTPHELTKLTRKLILTIDRAAAKAREQAASRNKQVRFWAEADGQAVAQGRGPMAQLAAVKASLAAWLRDNPKTSDDTRSESEREFDLFVALLTGGADAGSWQASIVVPFTTAAGGELELAEIPGFGPVLPSTAQELLKDAEWSQVAVDENGVLISASEPLPSRGASTEPAPQPAQSTGVNDWDAEPPASLFRKPVTLPTPRPPNAEWLATMRLLIRRPPPERLKAEQLDSQAYRTPDRLRRYLIARDRHCVFPGCHRRITDIDHRIPWPLGPTAAWNLQLLCRHHHRAKQAIFTVELTTRGDYLWTTRGGWQFQRQRQGY